MSSSSRERRGVSILEVLIALVIFLIALVPIADLATSSTRFTASASRMLESAMYAQRLLEAIAQLEPDELPPSEQDNWEVAMDGRRTAEGGSPRWLALAPALEARPPFPMEYRSVTAKKLAGGLVAVSFELVFLRVAGEPEEYTLVVRALLSPRSWP